MRLADLHDEGTRILAGCGIEEAENDARLLLCAAFSLSFSEYLLNRDRELSELYESVDAEAMREDYEHWVGLRRKRIPLQQILGSTAFMGLEFDVTPDVLIPRQDTETLVEQVLYDFPGKDISLLDMCTGSGCIAASLAVLGGYENVVGADISEEALYVARGNAMRLLKERSAAMDMKKSFISSLFSRDEDDLRQQVRFFRSDLFRGFEAAMDELQLDAFDVIVSNPPYIRSGDIEGLMPEVRDHEPRIALDGSEDGLHFYRRIAEECGPFLRDGGSIYLEIGCDQADEVKKIFGARGFDELTVIKDLAGNDRVIRGRKIGG